MQLPDQSSPGGPVLHGGRRAGTGRRRAPGGPARSRRRLVVSAPGPLVGDEQFSRSGVHRYAQQWATAMARLGFVPMSSAETERLLVVHAVRLAQALLAEPFSADPARRRRSGAGRGAPHRAGHDRLVGPYARHRIRDRRAARSARVAGGTGPDRPVAGRAGGGLRAGPARPDLQPAGADQPIGLAGPRRDRAGAARQRGAVPGGLQRRRRWASASPTPAAGSSTSTRPSPSMLGYSVDELREHQRDAPVPPGGRPRAAGELYQELIEGKREPVRVEKRYFRKDGSVVWTDLAVTLIRHDDGRPRFTVAMVQDITERYALQQRLRFQALHDPLTGLPNRTLFFERLAAVFAGGRRPTADRPLLPRPRRLQGDQRQPRPRRRRPVAGRRRPPARRLGRRPGTWWPGWAVTSS